MLDKAGEGVCRVHPEAHQLCSYPVGLTLYI